MSERMWLRATCLLVVFSASPALAAAKLDRMSGPFRVQTGISDSGDPVYTDCGQLNLYKSDTGREWRLEDACNQLIDLMVPDTTPTPTPTPIGTGPTPQPTQSGTVTGDCPDGFLAKANNTQWVLNNVSLDLNRTYSYCVDLPASSRPFFEVKTVNKGNSSCSDLEMLVISPQGTEYFSNGSQPGVPPLSSAGRWKIQLTLTQGCNRYDLSVNL